MFVRWQLRARKRRGGSPLLTALLVECRRIDREPRQRVVAYLAGIRARDVGENARKHDGFWERVDARLDEFAVNADTRARIEAQIAPRVPRVTDENRAQFEAAVARTRCEIAADFGIWPPGGAWALRGQLSSPSIRPNEVNSDLVRRGEAAARISPVHGEGRHGRPCPACAGEQVLAVDGRDRRPRLRQVLAPTQCCRRPARRAPPRRRRARPHPAGH